MKDLVKGGVGSVRRAGDRAQDAILMAAQKIEDRRDLIGSRSRPAEQVGLAASDLAATGRDEAIEEARAHRLFLGVELVDDLVKVASNDRRRALEPFEGGKPQHP